MKSCWSALALAVAFATPASADLCNDRATELTNVIGAKFMERTVTGTVLRMSHPLGTIEMVCRPNGGLQFAFDGQFATGTYINAFTTGGAAVLRIDIDLLAAVARQCQSKLARGTEDTAETEGQGFRVTCSYPGRTRDIGQSIMFVGPR